MNTTDLYCGNMLVGPLFWGAVSVPCACVGLPASVWLLWVLIQRQRSGSSNDIYMLNLSIMDLIYNAYLLPFILSYFIWQDLFSKSADVMFSFSFCGRPLFLACICADCYMAVVHPISYMKMKDTRYRVVVCVMVWALTASYGLMFSLKPELEFTPLVIVYFALCVPAIVCFDVAILYTLRKPGPSGNTDVHPQKQRALRVMANSLIVTLVSYLPSLLVYACTPVMGLTQQEMFCQVLFPTSANSALDSTIMPLLHLGNLGKLPPLRRLGCARRQ